MKILDVGTWYELLGLNCQKGKIYKYLWDLLLILWFPLGLGHDIYTLKNTEILGKEWCFSSGALCRGCSSNMTFVGLLYLEVDKSKMVCIGYKV